MNILSIGTVVKLKNGEKNLMIINRAPLCNKNGTIGYFDYSGCLFPEGQLSANVFFFNHEDIDKILFEGYINEDEEEFRKMYKEQVENVSYPKLSIDKDEKSGSKNTDGAGQ